MAKKIILSAEAIEPDPTPENRALAEWLNRLARRLSFNDVPKISDAYAYAVYAMAQSAVRWEREIGLMFGGEGEDASDE